MYIFNLYFMNCYTIYVNRHIKFFLLFFLIFFFPVNLSSHPQDYVKFKHIEMEVLRDGKIIGFSKYFFNYKDNFLEVKNETEFEVKLLGVKIFEIKSKGIEIYNNNRLISYNSKTYQNDKIKFVKLKLTKDKKEFKIIGSSFKGNGSSDFIIGNWWNHDILQAKSQISPLSGSIKEQVVTFVGKENIIFNNQTYLTEHYKLKSKDPNVPDDKKLNFDIWYSKDENLIFKIVYSNMGNWEYNVINFEKN